MTSYSALSTHTEHRVMYERADVQQPTVWARADSPQHAAELAGQARAEAVWGEVWIESREVTAWTRVAEESL